MNLPESITPAEFARRYGWSERRVRDKARELGACRILGNRMTLLPDDVQALLEATRCPSSSIAAARSGTTAGRLPAGGYEDLVKYAYPVDAHNRVSLLDVVSCLT